MTPAMFAATFSEAAGMAIIFAFAALLAGISFVVSSRRAKVRRDRTEREVNNV